jgi:two-component system sensor histidine kinase/response regulator
MKNWTSISSRTFQGIVFGLLFLIFGTLLEANRVHGNIDLNSLLLVQSDTLLIWLIDSAPFVLGIAGYVVGFRKTQVNQYIEQRVQQIQDELTKALDTHIDYKFALDKHALLAVTDRKGTITYVNDKFEDLSGYSAEELIGSNHSMLNSKVHNREFFKRLYATITAGRVWTGDICNRNKAGALYWVATTIVPFTNEVGKIDSYIALRTDITNQKLTEDALQAAKNRAEHANDVKGQFLTSMSHELRTPLNAIIGLSKALASDTTMIRSPQESEYITAINSSGQHLLSLIGDILDLSKLDAGARGLEKEPFTILELMKECRNTFLAACQDKGVSLSIDSQLEGAYPVLGDITVLKQILYNLLSNAVKFTQQGSISLTAVPYVAEEIGPNPNLGIMFIVADTGKGINADTIGTLFDSFTQEDNSITRSFGGSGLGLNIAQKLAQLMGGEISCNSVVGQGSTFKVIVYLEQQPISSEMRDLDNFEVFALPPLKLLIVDDVPLNLMVAAALLKPKGHIIETAKDGYKALEMASNNDYDAILMDVHMPGMDGMEATRQIRNCANKQRAAVPIVALSADVDVQQQALFIASGMDATVGKPWEVGVLENELKRILTLG